MQVNDSGTECTNEKCRCLIESLKAKALKLSGGYKAVLARTIEEHNQVTDRLKREFTDLEMKS